MSSSANEVPPVQGALPKGLVEWLSSGERGVSSNTIVQHLTGIPACGYDNHVGAPQDPADLDRCLALLEAVPLLRAFFVHMRTCSPEWAALVPIWDRLEASHLAEAGLGWKKARSAPKTYALMRSVLEPIARESERRYRASRSGPGAA